ncbi:MAG: 4Fe-4S dicluster domain-containing protein [Clostridia bacterium]|nr:4Fe-4S dicluster domain-containing protein [Clostridia bacterium]
MRKFDTKVQHLKYRVLREIARFAWEGTLLENLTRIPEIIVPGKEPTMRCCIYKERAIVNERVKLAMGGNPENPNVIEVIDIACDECPMGGYEVTDACRGCLAHRCEDVCKRGAITFDAQQKAHIDKTKCVECGLCAKVCPYSAIANHKRPCEQACKVKAISMGESKEATINNDKCISCGACVYQCPWGAIMDKSYILNAINLIKESEGNTRYHVYAVVAPSIASQFTYAKLGQVVKGIMNLGFYAVEEAATGADLVAYEEARELVERGFLTSSCCPAFVSYIKKQFPDLSPYISENLSPAATIARTIKEKDPTAKVIFIGPCTAKKMEMKEDAVAPYMDCVITFEELQALFSSRDFEIETFEELPLDNASYFGRIFGRSAGLTAAVAEALKEQGIEGFDLKAVTCNGIEACRMALLKASKRVLDGNFIEGMACLGGCVGGAGCLTHGDRNSAAVDAYAKNAGDRTISEVVRATEETE